MIAQNEEGNNSHSDANNENAQWNKQARLLKIFIDLSVRRKIEKTRQVKENNNKNCKSKFCRKCGANESMVVRQRRCEALVAQKC